MHTALIICQSELLQTWCGWRIWGQQWDKSTINKTINTKLWHTLNTLPNTQESNNTRGQMDIIDMYQTKMKQKWIQKTVSNLGGLFSVIWYNCNYERCYYIIKLQWCSHLPKQNTLIRWITTGERDQQTTPEILITTHSFIIRLPFVAYMQLRKRIQSSLGIFP